MKRSVLLLALILLCMPVLGLAGEPYRVLVMGTDFAVNQTESRDSKEVSRADVILVVVVPTDGSAIRVLNIERDYLVELPGDHGANKLNTASFFGGPQMLLEAVNTLFDLDLQDYVQVNIPAVEQIIDIFGGVDIYLHEDELSFISGEVGINHFGGERAAAYMRERDQSLNPVESNRARNERQMRVVSALLHKLPNIDRRQIRELADVLPQHMGTNMTLEGLMKVLSQVLGGGLSLEEYDVLDTPSTAFRVRRVNMHAVVVVADMEKEIEVVKDYLLYH